MTSPKPPPTSARAVLKGRLREVGPTFERQSRYLASKGVEVSGAFLCMLVAGKRDPSILMARQIAKALGLKISDVTGE